MTFTIAERADMDVRAPDGIVLPDSFNHRLPNLPNIVDCAQLFWSVKFDHACARLEPRHGGNIS